MKCQAVNTTHHSIVRTGASSLVEDEQLWNSRVLSTYILIVIHVFQWVSVVGYVLLQISTSLFGYRKFNISVFGCVFLQISTCLFIAETLDQFCMSLHKTEWWNQMFWQFNSIDKRLKTKLNISGVESKHWVVMGCWWLNLHEQLEWHSWVRSTTHPPPRSLTH